MSTTTTPQNRVGAAGIDPRGPQVAATLTAVVLVAVLLLAPATLGVALLAAQAGVFAAGAVRGVRRSGVVKTTTGVRSGHSTQRRAHAAVVHCAASGQQGRGHGHHCRQPRPLDLHSISARGRPVHHVVAERQLASTR